MKKAKRSSMFLILASLLYLGGISVPAGVAVGVEPCGPTTVKVDGNVLKVEATPSCENKITVVESATLEGKVFAVTDLHEEGAQGDPADGCVQVTEVQSIFTVTCAGDITSVQLDAHDMEDVVNATRVLSVPVTFIQNHAAPDVLRGGNQSDTVDYSNQQVGITATVGGTKGAAGPNGGTNQDTLSPKVENIKGGGGADTITGDALANVLDGNLGGDKLYGAGGDDTMEGGAENDYLAGEAGGDNMNGGDGDDTMLGGLGDDGVSGDAGNDKLLGNGDNDNMNGGAGEDTINGHSGNDTINGGDDNDPLLSGDADDDTINGEGGNDIAAGGTENDVVNGGDGDDSLTGEAGNDQLFGDDGENDYCEAAPGIDTEDSETCETSA